MRMNHDKSELSKAVRAVDKSENSANMDERGIGLEELQRRIRERGIREGDRWKDWREMVERGIGVGLPKKVAPTSKESLSKKINTMFEYALVGSGRAVEVTRVYEEPNKYKDKRESKTDPFVAAALLNHVPHKKKIRYPEISDKFHSFRGVAEQVKRVTLTRKQFISMLGLAINKEGFQEEMKHYAHRNDYLFTSTRVQTKVAGKLTDVFERFCERMRNKHLLSYHKGYIIVIDGEWCIPSVVEEAVIQNAKLKVLQKWGIDSESKIIVSGKYYHYKQDILAYLHEQDCNIGDFFIAYQLAYNEKELKDYVLKRFPEIPETQIIGERLLEVFLNSFYKSDKKYVDDLVKQVGETSLEDILLQNASAIPELDEDFIQDSAKNFTSLKELAASKCDLPMPERFEGNFVLSSFPQDTQKLYRALLYNEVRWDSTKSRQENINAICNGE